jgi:hypothetical protein
MFFEFNIKELLYIGNHNCRFALRKLFYIMMNNCSLILNLLIYMYSQIVKIIGGSLWRKITYLFPRIVPKMFVQPLSQKCNPPTLNRKVWICLWSVSFASALTWFIRYIYYWNVQFPNNVIINKTKALLPQT